MRWSWATLWSARRESWETFEAERRGAARVSWRRAWKPAGESSGGDMLVVDRPSFCRCEKYQSTPRGFGDMRCGG